jgi:hypothetical protein
MREEGAENPVNPGEKITFGRQYLPIEGISFCLNFLN